MCFADSLILPFILTNDGKKCNSFYVSCRSVDIGLGVEGVTSPCEDDSHSSAAEVTLKLLSDPERPTNLTEAESETEPG